MSTAEGVGFDIDLSARALARATITIAAPRPVVWALLSEPGRWPAWSSAVEWVGLETPPTTGVAFEWRAGGLTIRSRIETFDAPTRIGWTGTAPLITARHVYTLSDTGLGTRVDTAESFRGVFAAVLPGKARTLISRALNQGLADLKKACEAPIPRSST